MQSFIEVAEEAVAILEAGLPVLEAYPVLRQLEQKRVAMFGESTWPGCLFEFRDGEYKVATSQPHLDQFHDAHFEELEDKDDAELREHLLIVLNAWLRESTRLGQRPIYGKIRECYSAFNNLLPGRCTFEERKVDAVLEVTELLDAYTAVVDSGFIDFGGDPFARREVEFSGIVATSHARLIVELAANALERVFTLVSEKPIAFHKYQPEHSLEDLPKIREVKGDVVSQAAAGLEIDRDRLEALLNRFVIESEINEVTQQKTVDIPRTAFEYVRVTKARLRVLYGKDSGTATKSESWLTKELKKEPSTLPIKDVTRNHVWLCTKENERLLKVEQKFDLEQLRKWQNR